MHELYVLKEVAEQQLLPAGYVLDVEEKHPDDFGSYFAVYMRATHQIRFVWDGKDGCGFLEHRETNSETWELIGSPVPESATEAMREAATIEWPDALAPILAEF
jgi:hypothetical protein